MKMGKAKTVKINEKSYKKLKEIKKKTGWSFTYILQKILEGIDVEKIPPQKRYTIIIKEVDE